MKTIAKIKYALFLIIIVGFASCKGEIGPIGPDGTDGTDGTDGIDGIDGTAGEDGNANVIISDWITPVWTGTMPSTSGVYVHATGEDLDTGAFLPYIDLNGNGEFIYTIPMTSGGTTYYCGIQNSQSVRWIFSAETAVTPSANIQLRYIFIPATSTKSANSKQAILDQLENDGVDISNYYEVMDYYGLDY